MVTIKEIANIAGVSPSTVSIVLNGRSHERKISEQTKANVLSVAGQLGYRANVAARQLRTSQSSNLRISVFMVMDHRAYLMSQFLFGLQGAAEAYGQPFEMDVHFYPSGSLHLFAETINFTNCAIICNASEDDLHFLEGSQFFAPIVLLYRTSEKYSTVNVNWTLVGEKAASIFARRGHKHAALLALDTYYPGIKQCNAQFTKTAEQNGLSVSYIQETHDIHGGYRGGFRIGEMRPMPDCVFTMSGFMSIGALRAFEQQGIQVPKQIELISLGTDEIDTFGIYEYANVPISSISIPVKLLAAECIRLLFLQLNGEMSEACAVEVPVSYICRESCGE